MQPARPPIVVNENGDLTFHDSVSDAEASMEPVDVANGEYVAYDADGHRLRLEFDPRETVRGFVVSNDYGVRIRPAEDEPSGEAELRAALVRFIRSAGFAEPDAPETEDLAALISRARRPWPRRR